MDPTKFMWTSSSGGERIKTWSGPSMKEIIDIEEFDRDEDLTGHLFTKRNVGEMMPGKVRFASLL